MKNSRNIDLALVDDDPLFLDYLSNLMKLEPGVRVIPCGSEDALIDAMRANPVDCIVLDYDLGTNNGLAVGEKLKAMFANVPPVVMLTGGGSERTAIKAFRSGFSDYVSKRGFQSTELVSAVRSAVERSDVEKAERLAVASLAARPDFDEITGIYSSTFMRKRIAEMRSAGVEQAFALVVLELKEASRLRRDLGYVVAQRLFHVFATNVRRVVRGEEIFGHCDADRFAVIIDSEPLGRGCEGIVARICEELDKEIIIDRVSVRIAPEIDVLTYPRDADRIETFFTTGATNPIGEACAAVSAGMSANSELLAAAHATTPTTPLNEAPFVDRRIGAATNVSVLTERRRERRQRVLKRAKIAIGRGDAVIDCSVRDLSCHGARLRMDAYCAVPDSFELRIVGSGRNVAVTKRWQIANDLGVEFLRSDQ